MDMMMNREHNKKKVDKVIYFSFNIYKQKKKENNFDDEI